MRLAASILALVFSIAPMAAYAENDAAFSAYRTANDSAAWSDLNDAAQSGDRRARRNLAYMLLDNAAPLEGVDQPSRGVEILAELAHAGDYPALIKLNRLIEDGARHAPEVESIIGIEETLAMRGDAVAAWRLARRYQIGEGVEPSFKRAARWLEIAATTPADRFPKAPDAALELCGLYLEADARKAREWCGLAAEAGKPAARIALRRLAQLPG